MPRKRRSAPAGLSDLLRVAGGINENGGTGMTKEQFVEALPDRAWLE